MRTILLVDDQPSVVSTLAYFFSSSRHVVLSATSGAEALRLAATSEFDVALLDLHMPGMDGITLCRALREPAYSSGRQPLVWIMTAAYTTEAAQLAVEAGACSLIKKPFNPVEWLTTVERSITASLPTDERTPPSRPPALDSDPHTPAPNGDVNASCTIAAATTFAPRTRVCRFS